MINNPGGTNLDCVYIDVLMALSDRADWNQNINVLTMMVIVIIHILSVVF